MIRYQAIWKIMGGLLMLFGLLMLPGIGFSYYYGSSDKMALVYSALITFSTGALFYLSFVRDIHQIRKREGYLIVTLSWLLMSMFGTLPYLISGTLDNLPDAIFETVSGLSTTGATIVQEIESLSAGIMLWRSMTQWIGGLGIIVLTVAIFPLLGIGGIELFVAEAPGPTADKLHPRIRETAKRLWFVYVGLTIILCLLLYVAGMTFVDAVNHALTTMATGGFSTKGASIAYFEAPSIQYIIIFFMFLSGTNFTLIYFGIRGKLNRVWGNDEFRMYLWLVFAVAIMLFFPFYFLSDTDFEQSFRDSLFQVVSFVSTTGFVTVDYLSYSNGVATVFFLLLFVGACAGSTSGGIKVIRHLAFVKNTYLEFKRIVHPRAVVPLKINGERVRGRVVTHIMNFLLIYLLIFVLGSMVLSLAGHDLETSFGAVASTLGNVGPGIGRVGPIDDYAFFSPFVKIFLCFLMLLGRLELFTILVLFTPFFWRAN